jgi:hypothetical protein
MMKTDLLRPPLAFKFRGRNVVPRLPMAGSCSPLTGGYKEAIGAPTIVERAWIVQLDDSLPRTQSLRAFSYVGLSAFQIGLSFVFL